MCDVSKDFENEIIRIPRNGNAIVVIGDKERCEPCKRIDEFFNKRQERDITVVDIELSDWNKAFPKLRIFAIPKLFFLQDGKVVLNYDGFPGSDGLNELIDVVFK